MPRRPRVPHISAHAATASGTTIVSSLRIYRRRLWQRWADAVGRLTPREQEVLRLMSLGLSNSEIGAALFLGTQRQDPRRRGACQVGVRDRTQAVIAAHESGFLD